MRYIKFAIFMVLILSLLSSPAMATTVGGVDMQGEYVTFVSQNPIKTAYMIPLRKAMEAMGYQVSWNGQAAIIAREEITEKSTIGNITLKTINSPAVTWEVYDGGSIKVTSGETVYTHNLQPGEAKPKIKDGRMFVPLETLTTVFGLTERK